MRFSTRLQNPARYKYGLDKTTRKSKQRGNDTHKHGVMLNARQRSQMVEAYTYTYDERMEIRVQGTLSSKDTCRPHPSHLFMTVTESMRAGWQAITLARNLKGTTHTSHRVVGYDVNESSSEVRKDDHAPFLHLLHKTNPS